MVPFFANASVGDEVVSFVYGDGVISRIKTEPLRTLYVTFEDGTTREYTAHGFEESYHVFPTLFWKMPRYTVWNPPYDRIEQNTNLIVWNYKEGKTFRAHLYKFNKRGLPMCYKDGKSKWTNGNIESYNTFNFWKLDPEIPTFKYAKVDDSVWSIYDGRCIITEVSNHYGFIKIRTSTGEVKMYDLRGHAYKGLYKNPIIFWGPISLHSIPQPERKNRIVIKKDAFGNNVIMSLDASTTVRSLVELYLEERKEKIEELEEGCYTLAVVGDAEVELNLEFTRIPKCEE
jgi:hypothetical protein